MTQPFGLIIVDKPPGPTSHKVVSIVRRGTGARKVGHAGTLDPRASGVLVLCIGAATRLSEYLSTSTKRYEAVVKFGTSTATYDSDGDVVKLTGAAPSLEEIRDALPHFRGEIQQAPPPYSAIKVKGKKAYELARAGEDIDLEPRSVELFRLEIIDYRPPDLVLDVECTAGTYIRSLAHDLGEELNTGAHLADLRRTKAGPFSIEDAVSLTELELTFVSGDWERYLRPAQDALPEFESVKVTGENYEAVRFGRRIPAVNAHGMAKAIAPDGDIIAILEAVEDGKAWHPRKVFNR